MQGLEDDIESIADWRPFASRHVVVSSEIGADAVAVEWSDGRISPFHFAWLRDNCPCVRCVHPLTREQVFEIVDAPADLTAARTHRLAAGGLSVEWSDGHQSRFEAGWLRANAYDDASRAERARPAPKRLWGAGLGGALPTYDHAELQADGSAFEDWLTALDDVGLTLVRHAPTHPGAVLDLARRIGCVRETNFGVLFDVESKPRPDSNAYTSINLPPHTDLPTRELQPGLQLLQCLVNETTGGDSVFVDGFAIAEAVRAASPDDFAVLTEQAFSFWNKDERSDYRRAAPIITLDDAGEIVEVRYANFLRGPIDAPAAAMDGIYRAYRRFVMLTRDESFRVVRRLEPGDVWVFDNRRVLHARTAFDPTIGRRWLQGCYVDRDELISRLRIVRR